MERPPQLPTCASLQKQGPVSEYPLQRAARLARRMPGYRWVRRRALPRIRQSAAARTLALRLFAIESRTSAQSVEAPLELPAGRLLAGLGTERLPVILVSLVGLTDALDDKATVDELIDAVIDQVAEAQLLGAGFRPVLLLDTPSFSRARSCGYVVELITPRSVWQAEPTDWPEYIAARVASMTTAYGVSTMISVGPNGLDDVARGVLRSFG
jgi:hypothetical protein